MSKLQEILRRKAERKARLQAALDSIVSQLKEMGALKVILFGSLADGHVDIWSDLDLFVIMPSTKTGKEWIDLVYDKVERNIAADIIVYNEREFNQRLPQSRFLQHILKGMVVYEKTA